MSHRCQLDGKRSTIAVILVVLLTALAGCTDSPPSSVPGGSDRPTEPGFLVSYAGAAGRLDGLDPAETEEQLRDWARTGLAAHLEMDTARLRDATFDTLPVRDTGLADLARQATGPGRALYDGKDVLHLLVPRGDPHRARTVGLLLDQYRADAGTDPPQVQVHDYEILSGVRAIAVAIGKPAPVAEVRTAHGYVSLRVDQTGGLTDFLAKTRHLSEVEIRGSEIWAEGWNWPSVPAAPVSADDVSVIQRGYSSASGPTPGFSLDPGPRETAADILAIVPSLSPAVAEAVAAGNGADASSSAGKLRQEIVNALFSDASPPAGLPADRTRLWALLQALEGQPSYSQARYDGPLAGTEVGMTLFYADYQAKHWAKGVGEGVPAKAVAGFVPDPDAATPWGHCPEGDTPMSESGRLWFGQAESGFAFDTKRISIGAQATRLFAKSNGDAGTEVETSYAFGRGLRWWDQHFQAVADYEPQYQRLDQIMRWSGALEWLSTKAGKQLPESDKPASSGLRFADWYSRHQELREKSTIDFVTPPSATQEAVLSKPSKTFTDCGFRKIFGGVSLGDLLTRQGEQNYHPTLPPSVRRAGLVDQGSAFDSTTGTGHVKEVSLDSAGKVESYRERTFSPLADGKAAVETTASGRREVSLGDLKVPGDANAPRKIKNEFSAERGHIVQRAEFQGTELGTLEAHKNRDSVSVGWRSGPVDRALHLLRSMQNRWGSEPNTGTLLSYQGSDGRIQYQLGGLDAPWLEIAKEMTPPGGLTFRLGAPHPQRGTAEFALGMVRGPPHLGGPDQWLAITPADAQHPARIAPADAPKPDARTVPVATPEGKTFTVFQTGDQWSVVQKELANEPEFAAALTQFGVLDKARQEAGDSYYRAYPLDGSGVALVGADKVIVVSNFHPWAAPALNATVPGQPAPLFLIAGKEILHVDKATIKVEPGAEVRHEKLGDVLKRDENAYLRENARVTFGLADGPIIADALPRDAAVTVVSATVEVVASSERLAWQPDVRVHAGAQWQRVNSGGFPPGLRGSLRVPGSGTVQTTSASPTTTASSTTSGTVALPATGGLTILLVCPDTDPALSGCGS